jgi:hypothetical protein
VEAMGIRSYPSQAERDAAIRQLECGLQAFLAAEEIQEDHQRIAWPQFGGEPVPCKHLCGPWRRVDG